MPDRSWWGSERCNCQSSVGIILREMSMMERLVAGDNCPRKEEAHEKLLPTSPCFIGVKSTARS